MQLLISYDPGTITTVGVWQEGLPREVWDARQDALDSLADFVDEWEYGGFPYWKSKADALCAAELVTEAYPGTTVHVSQVHDGGWICD